jgi:hypothetical protein
MVNTASAEDNHNMRDFLCDWVFVLQESPDDDHHLPDLPTTVKALIETSR